MVAKNFPKIYVGTMSRNVVDAVASTGDIGLIASRRQVEWDGGYANRWTTSEWYRYVKNIDNKILVARDHGGPMQGKTPDDGLTSLSHDICLDLIHVDPWLTSKDFNDNILRTSELIKFCCNAGFTGYFEIGTEESICPISTCQLYEFLSGIRDKLGNLFDKIAYCVIQCGTSLQGIKNTGKYDEQKLKDMVFVCKQFGLLSKEHNGDYQTNESISGKFKLGLDAINIAPEFGMIESSVVLDHIKEQPQLVNMFFDLCYKSNKWKKWVDPSFDPNVMKEETIRISGHYVFSENEFINRISKNEQLQEKIQLSLKSRLLELKNLEI